MSHIICIGREYGSGGREIGEKLSQKLNIPCYDKLLVKKAAEDLQMDEAVVEKYDEKPIKVRQFLTGNVFVDSAGIANSFYSESQVAYEAQKRVIEELAARGDCIIIGRCASSVLKRNDCLSVFIYGDKADRIERVARRNQLEEKEAEQRIRRIDRLRRQYFDFYSDTQWGIRESYDLMLSSSKYGIDGCVEIIADSIRNIGEEK